MCGYSQSTLMLIYYTSVKQETPRHVHFWVEIWCRNMFVTHTLQKIKCTFDRADYLQVLENRMFRNVTAELRLSSHTLFVETGRHRQIPRQDRKYILCNIDDVEDEYHVILICPFYNNIRITHIPSLFKCVQLLNETSKPVLVKLSSFCLKAFKLKGEHLNV